MQPGPAGLVPCDAGTVVTVSLCGDSSCNSDTLTILDFGLVAADGGFSFALDSREVKGSRLVFQAAIVQETIHVVDYRIIDFGPIGNTRRRGTLDHIEIDPSSEAAVRLLYERGLQNYTDEGIKEVIQAVRTADDSAALAGVSPADAATLATETARIDPMVQATLQNPQFVPTPTASPRGPVCVGDCNDSGDVTVDELLTLVNIALGNAETSSCDAGDANHDTQVTIDEILTAVNNALNGCSQ